MTIDFQGIRSEQFVEIGRLLQQGASLISDRWLEDATREQPNAQQSHREEMVNQLPQFLEALGQSLAEAGPALRAREYHLAAEHGKQRWKVRWRLDEVVRDYQILRLVILDYLQESLPRPLDVREAIAVGISLDEAVTSSIGAYVQQSESRIRSLNESLEQRVAERTVVAEQQARQLRQLALDLTQTEHRERRRLAQILHDHLQQLLVATLMNVDVLTHRVADEDCNRLLEQTNDLLNQSIEASRSLAVELSPPILHEKGLAAALEWLAHWMQEKHGLRVEVAADIRAEPAGENVRIALFEAVRESLFNVVKHAGVDRAEVCMTRHERDAEETVQIIVIDAGAGFVPRQLEDSREASTVGFGLSTIGQRLKLLGGGLEVESSPGGGTRVILWAPRHQRDGDRLSQPAQPELSDLPGEASPDVGGRGIRVLLADDHRILRSGLVGLLEDEPDIQVVAEAADGQTAVELARDLQPDIVVMDVNMPGINGLAATHHITTEMPHVRVIVLSFHDEAGMTDAMRDAGAATYLTKDKAIHELVSAIRDVYGSA